MHPIQIVSPLLLIAFVVPTSSAQEPNAPDVARLARLAVAQSTGYGREFDNIFHQTLIGTNSVHIGNSKTRNRKHYLPDETLSESEDIAFQKEAMILYRKTGRWHRSEKEVEDTSAAKLQAAKDFWLWSKAELPESVRHQIVWMHYGIYGPEYFFSKSFIGAEVGLREEQLESIRTIRKNCNESFAGQSLAIEEIGYDTILGKLSSKQLRKLKTKFEEEYLQTLLTLQRRTSSSFDFNTNTSGLIPLDWAKISVDKYPHNRLGLFPECLLESKASLGCCRSLDEFRQQSKLMINDGAFGHYSGSWILLEQNSDYVLDSSLLESFVDANNKATSYEDRREKYNATYMALLGQADDEETSVLLACEFLQRGLIRFLIEPSIAKWLGYPEGKAEELLETSEEVRIDSIKLRQELINSNLRNLFSILDLDQRRKLEELFGLPIDKITTLFQACSDRELRNLLGDTAPSFKSTKYINSGASAR